MVKSSSKSNELQEFQIVENTCKKKGWQCGVKNKTGIVENVFKFKHNGAY